MRHGHFNGHLYYPGVDYANQRLGTQVETEVWIGLVDELLRQKDFKKG